MAQFIFNLVFAGYGFGDFFPNALLESTPEAIKRDSKCVLPHLQLFRYLSMRFFPPPHEQRNHFVKELFAAILFVTSFELF